MSEKILQTRIQNKIDTTSNWSTANPILKNGEIGLERTTSGAIKMKIGDGATAWNSLNYMVSDNSGSGSGASYTAGNGIKINNDVISTIYGDEETVTETYIFGQPENATTEFSEFENMGEDWNAFTFSFLSDAAINSILKTNSFSLVFKSEGTVVKTFPINIHALTLFEGTEMEIAGEFSGDGDINILEYLYSEGEYEPAATALESKDLSSIFALISQEENENLYYSFMANSSWFNSDIDQIEIQYSQTLGKTIPSNAIRAGKGINIGTNATINLDYGQQTGTVENITWDIDSFEEASSTLFGSLYGWYYNQSSQYFSPINQNTTINDMVINPFTFYYIYKDSDNQIYDYDRICSQNSISKDDEYELFWTEIKIGEIQDNSQPNENYIAIKCEALPSTNNYLYTLFEDILDTENTDYNTFFFGTFNTTDTFDDIITNETISIDDSSFPTALAVIVLVQQYKTYLIILSPDSDLGGIIFKENGFFIANTLPKHKTFPAKMLGTEGSLAQGRDSFARGYSAIAKGDYSVALGRQVTANSDYSLAIGDRNDSKSSETRYFSIGTGNNRDEFYINENGQAYKYSDNQQQHIPYLTPDNINEYVSSGSSESYSLGDIANESTDLVTSGKIYSKFYQYFQGYDSNVLSTTDQQVNHTYNVSGNIPTPGSYDYYDSSNGSWSTLTCSNEYGMTDYISIPWGPTIKIYNYNGSYTDNKVYVYYMSSGEETYTFAEALDVTTYSGYVTITPKGSPSGDMYIKYVATITNSKYDKDNDTYTYQGGYIEYEQQETETVYHLKSSLFPSDIGGGVTSYNDLTDKPTIPSITTSISNQSTNSEAAGAAAVYNYVSNATAGVDGAMHFRGTTASSIADGNSVSAVSINNTSTTINRGDIVLNNNNAFVSDGTYWRQISDGSSWVPQTRTINSKELSADIILYATDIALSSSDNTKMDAKFANYIPTTAKVTSISSSSTDNQIPTAKAVWDLLETFVD